MAVNETAMERHLRELVDTESCQLLVISTEDGIEFVCRYTDHRKAWGGVGVTVSGPLSNESLTDAVAMAAERLSGMTGHVDCDCCGRVVQ